MENKEEVSVMDQETTEETVVAADTEIKEETVVTADTETTEEKVEELSAEETLQNEIEQLKKQLEEADNKYLRLHADTENFKQRMRNEQATLQKYKAQSVMTNVLPVLDNFERALQVDAKTEEARSMMEGMDMIYRSLVEALKSEGLEPIEAVDQPFDPNVHQAVMTDHDDEKDSGIVLDELQKGYKLKDRVLRPTMVKVNE